MPLPVIGLGAMAGRAGTAAPWLLQAGYAGVGALKSTLPQYVQTVRVVVQGTRKSRLRDCQFLAYAVAWGQLDAVTDKPLGSTYSVQMTVDPMNRRVELNVQRIYNAMTDYVLGNLGAGKRAMQEPLADDIKGGDWPAFFKPPTDTTTVPVPLPAADQLIATSDVGEAHPLIEDGYGTNFASLVAASLLASCRSPSAPNYDPTLSELSTVPGTSELTSVPPRPPVPPPPPTTAPSTTELVTVPTLPLPLPPPAPPSPPPPPPPPPIGLQDVPVVVGPFYVPPGVVP